MTSLAKLLDDAQKAGVFERVARNNAAQFGPRGRSYLGASILPEENVLELAYREEYIHFRSVVANAGTRYGPVQLKGADLMGSFLVELAHSDIGRELTSRDYDTLVAYLNDNRDIEAMARLVNWVDTSGVRPLLEHNEKNRWEAIVDSSVVLTGDNAYSETVAYYDPAGHRAAITAPWSVDTNDPMDDIFAMRDLLATKGYTVNRIISSTPVMSILSKNANMRTRAGTAIVGVTDGAYRVVGGPASHTALNGVMGENGLPPIEIYDLQYRTQDSSGFFLKRDVMVMLCTTGRDTTIDLGDAGTHTLMDTFGYTGVGPAAGQSGPGRVLLVESFKNKPPRVQVEGWQASLPVITEPEAIGVLNTIT